MQRIIAVVALALALVVALPGLAAASDDPFFSEQWSLGAIGAETAWNQGRGAGVTIAVVDTGVDLDHPDLVDKLVAGYDFVDGDSLPDDEGRPGCTLPRAGEARTCDEGRGHGSHVAGIAAASTGNGVGVAGVAPDARIMPVRVLDPDGTGNLSTVISGIKFAADNGADVINLSFGEAAKQVGLDRDFATAIRYAWSKGAIPVVAAGNSFVRSSGFTDEPAIVVTATNRAGGRPSYASGVGGAQWGMAAPGGDGSTTEKCTPETGIVSTYADQLYACLAGTSMSAPHVSGAAAVLLSMGLSPQEVVDRLLASADDLGAPGRDATFGAGQLNLARAVEAPAPPPPAPTTTEVPAASAAAPGPTTTRAPTTTTTEAPTTTTEPATTIIPPTTAPQVQLPGGEAVLVLPDDDGESNARYVVAVPAAILAAGVGMFSWRLRRQLPGPLRPGG